MPERRNARKARGAPKVELIDEGMREGDKQVKPREENPPDGIIGDAAGQERGLSEKQHGRNQGHIAQREGHLRRSPTVKRGGQVTGRETGASDGEDQSNRGKDG